MSFEQMIGELNSFLTGWVTYFRHAKAKDVLSTSWTVGFVASCVACG